MIDVIISGIAGRMGKRIAHTVYNNPQTTIIGGLEIRNHPAVGQDVGELAGIGRLQLKVTDNLESLWNKGDVVVEFTSIDATLAHMRLAAKRRKAMVIGTTGFTDAQMEEIQDLTKNFPCVLAPNMSIGINLILKILKEMARVLKNDYDVEIIETHHHLKKDAPSGTAMKIAEVLANALKRKLSKVAVYGRKGMVGERKHKEIGIHTIRAGDIVGTHTVLFGGEGESIEVTHRAHSRDTFAMGAVKAVKFIVGAENGLYDMNDVLQLSRRKEKKESS
jgi:4-hydroxy-tetrahydrodipicolinate reductase